MIRIYKFLLSLLVIPFMFTVLGVIACFIMLLPLLVLINPNILSLKGNE